jgi:hypothetical protein
MVAPAIHYAAPEERRRYDILQSIRTLTLLEHKHPGKRRGGRYHFYAPAEMAAGCAQHPEWLRATHEIAERCDFALPFGKPQFPAFKAPDGLSSKEFLRHLVRDGLRQRYTGQRIISDTGTEVPLAQVRAQVEEELSIIADVGYEDYFLITWDFLQDCRQRGIEWITRGSAADSLVAIASASAALPERFACIFGGSSTGTHGAEQTAGHRHDFAHIKDDVVQPFSRSMAGSIALSWAGFRPSSAGVREAKVLAWGKRGPEVHRALSVGFRRRLGAGRAGAKERRRSD